MIATTSWNQFVWQTNLLPTESVLEAPFSIRRARSEEREKVTQVALLALTMNTEWYSASSVAAACIKAAGERAFAQHQEPSVLVMTHGSRIIGVSILDVHPDASYHLTSGPWILMEYRNRGLGTALLQASLQELSHHGVVEARAVTRAKSIAARFVYPKFGGEMSAGEAPSLPSEMVQKK